MQVKSELKLGLSALAIAAALAFAMPASAGDAGVDMTETEVVVVDGDDAVCDDCGEVVEEDVVEGNEGDGGEGDGGEGGGDVVDGGEGEPETGGPDPMPIDDDGMAWTGGDPDFCEECSGAGDGVVLVDPMPESLPDGGEDVGVVSDGTGLPGDDIVVVTAVDDDAIEPRIRESALGGAAISRQEDSTFEDRQACLKRVGKALTMLCKH